MKARLSAVDGWKPVTAGTMVVSKEGMEICQGGLAGSNRCGYGVIDEVGDAAARCDS
ncbi:MAG: hypothetical protein MZV63_62155 [Marinilabiliales bacterium]|nr:hypothetical protein [Marinilabiliales bacterium]